MVTLTTKKTISTHPFDCNRPVTGKEKPTLPEAKGSTTCPGSTLDCNQSRATPITVNLINYCWVGDLLWKSFLTLLITTQCLDKMIANWWLYSSFLITILDNFGTVCIMQSGLLYSSPPAPWSSCLDPNCCPNLTTFTPCLIRLLYTGYHCLCRTLHVQSTKYGQK